MMVANTEITPATPHPYTLFGLHTAGDVTASTEHAICIPQAASDEPCVGEPLNDESQRVVFDGAQDLDVARGLIVYNLLALISDADRMTASE